MPTLFSLDVTLRYAHNFAGRCVCLCSCHPEHRLTCSGQYDGPILCRFASQCGLPWPENRHALGEGLVGGMAAHRGSSLCRLRIMRHAHEIAVWRKGGPAVKDMMMEGFP
jgi:hypothetical protein